MRRLFGMRSILKGSLGWERDKLVGIIVQRLNPVQFVGIALIRI